MLFDIPGYVPFVPTFSTATSYCGASEAEKRQPIRHFLIEGSLLTVIYIKIISFFFLFYQMNRRLTVIGYDAREPI